MSEQERWRVVDDYLASTVLGSDPATESARDASLQAGMPDIGVSPAHGKLLQLLAGSVRAASILEIGTLGGYSAIWMARALADGGRLVSIEINPDHAAVASRNLEKAGLADRCDIRVGAALQVLPELAREGREPFDLVFIDADKENIPEYFEWALRLTRPGSLIVVDNMVRRGALADADSTDTAVLGVRRLCEKLTTEDRVEATVIQTVGVKGYDGFLLALVTAGE